LHSTDNSSKHIYPHTPSTFYNEQYYLTACEGYNSFTAESGEEVISPRLAAALKLVVVNQGERVLDIGCGRGEAILHLAQSGAVAYGVDYSSDALRIARRHLSAEKKEHQGQNIYLVQADAKWLPFKDSSFDKLLMFDIIEHLYPWELTEALREARRVLVPGGQLLIHTAPNRWYYQFGYPLYRVFERLRGKHLPSNPRSRFPFHYLHVNEQDVLRLQRSLRQTGFECKVWLDNIQPILLFKHSILNLILSKLLRIYPFRWIFCNDIFAIARKGKVSNEVHG
jgi:ubiquinone/menaquinone biosynthesis C-methylase UbiE